MGSVTRVPWEIVGILPLVVSLGAFTLPSPISPCTWETLREAGAAFPCLAQAWAWPEVPNDSSRGAHSVGLGDQDSPEPKPDLWGHMQPLGAQIQAEGQLGQQ